MNVSPPTITGTPVVGRVLTATSGSWSSKGPNPTYSYQWQDCDTTGKNCVAIAKATATTYTVAATDLAHTINVKVTAATKFAAATAYSAPTAVVTAADATTPTKPTNFVATSTTQTSVATSWTASTDPDSTITYTLYRNGTQITTTAGTTYTFAGLACGTTYTFGVDASDPAQNRSAQATLTTATAACTSPPPTSGGLHVSGNKLLDANGNVVHFHGVDRSGTEYACIQGWGIFDGPSDDASISAIRSWNANIVHIGLNEDCILGINGVPSQYAGSTYMNAVVNFVNLVHAHGMYAEVNIFWAAPGSTKATSQLPMLDADHGTAALQAMANAFKNDPKTILGITEEPHDISWSCWLNGGSSCSVGYTALGMQAALNAIRATGATNVVEISGTNWANDLSQWLTYKPNDPLGQIVAQGDFYGNNACGGPTCFDSTVAPVAQQVPVIMGETGETYDDSSCGSTNTQAMFNWDDAHGVGYLSWVWDTWGTCLSLISNYNGTAANSAYANYVRTHFLSQP